jgi:hypothetical protein
VPVKLVAHSPAPLAPLFRYELQPYMNVLLLTVFIGLVFATLFIVLFLYQISSRRFGGSERESLMPLHEERVRPHNPRHRNAN